MTPNDIDALIARAADGTLSSEDALILLEACKRKPELQKQLRDHLVMERLLSLHGAQQSVPDGFAKEVLARIEGQTASSETFTPRVMERLPIESANRVRLFPQWSILAAAALLTISVIGWWTLSSSNSRATVARLVASEAVSGLEKSNVFVAGQRLQFTSGFVRLQFQRGADVLLEGPAELEFTSDNGAILHRGSVSVHVPESATGFTLIGPDARVIDVGTRFAMKVSPDQPTEVHVLEGLVLTSTKANPEKHEMRQDEAIEVVDGVAQKIRAEPTHFVTALPERKKGPIDYLHWSFDEKGGPESHNSGPGIAGSTSSAFMRTVEPDSPGPQRVEGVFGSAIFLDGDDAFLDTDFPGIGGGRARTVAMWMKVPQDWTPQHGYALASWGSLKKPGSAWQMSVNPGDFGGAIGHLRVGVHDSYAVGTTDLRDGRWHHIAAVMYEDEQVAVATHVLLYVDGMLEHAEIKSTRTIDTDIASRSAVKLQLGRNLSTATGSTTAKRFFRGWIDEVFVAGEALTQKQIRSLMKVNRLEE